MADLVLYRHSAKLRLKDSKQNVSVRHAGFLV